MTETASSNGTFVNGERIDEYQQKLESAGVECTPVVNHDDSEKQASPSITDTTFVRSIYFKDPDGILLEFAAWTRELDERDVSIAPVSVD